MSAVVGRSERDALRQYLGPLEAALACFAPNVHLVRTGPDPQANAHLLAFAGDAIDLRGGEGASRLALALRLYFRVRPLAPPFGPPGRFTVETTAYVYRLEDAGDPERQIAGYHWHPHVAGIPFPHLHPLAATGGAQRLHYAMPYATLRHVLLFAMRDLGVQPIRPNWERALIEVSTMLEASMSAAAQWS